MSEESSNTLQLMHKIFDENKDNQNEELFFTFKGVLYPNRLCSAETFETLETIEARKDDMLVVAYPKCGTNWVFHILCEMVAATQSSKDLPLTRHLLMLEFGSPEKVLRMKEQPSPRYYATHLYYDNIPKSFLENKVKMLVVFRNPKDAAISYYHFYNKNPLLPNVSSWDDFFQKFMNGEEDLIRLSGRDCVHIISVGWNSYFDHAVAWDKHMDEENIMIITYEELKENLLEGVKQIADFYELPLSDEMIKSIADKATFQAMSSKSPETLGPFAPVIFRKGEVGDWKTLFTEAQSKEMDAKFEACLAGTKLGAKLKYDKYCKF